MQKQPIPGHVFLAFALAGVTLALVGLPIWGAFFGGFAIGGVLGRANL